MPTQESSRPPKPLVGWACLVGLAAGAWAGNLLHSPKAFDVNWLTGGLVGFFLGACVGAVIDRERRGPKAAA